MISDLPWKGSLILSSSGPLFSTPGPFLHIGQVASLVLCPDGVVYLAIVLSEWEGQKGLVPQDMNSVPFFLFFLNSVPFLNGMFSFSENPVSRLRLFHQESSLGKPFPCGHLLVCWDLFPIHPTGLGVRYYNEICLLLLTS